jgi:hypothetical protein
VNGDVVVVSAHHDDAAYGRAERCVVLRVAASTCAHLVRTTVGHFWRPGNCKDDADVGPTRGQRGPDVLDIVDESELVRTRTRSLEDSFI